VCLRALSNRQKIKVTIIYQVLLFIYLLKKTKMKFCYLHVLLLFVAFGCNSKPQNENVAATSTPSVSTAPQAAVVSADCKRVGTAIDKFEQNNAVFERFQNEKTEQEWLKITTKDGGCSIVDSIGNANHDAVRFEDWDKDGFKDRINESKWYYEVALFNAQTNDFSRPIEGIFSGDQWDFDKARGLKYQHLENKSGGHYELYKISDLKKLVYADISIEDPSYEGTNYVIEVANRKGGTDNSTDRTVIKTSPALMKAVKAINGEADGNWSKRVKAAVEDYWRKNEAVFVPK
jgi:hypothetical protein